MDNKIQLLLEEISDAALSYLLPGFRRERDNNEMHSSITQAEYCLKRKSLLAKEIVDEEPDLLTHLQEKACFNVSEPVCHGFVARKEAYYDRRKPIDADTIEIQQQERRFIAINDEITTLLKKYNITLSELEQLLAYRIELSHLKITRDNNIILDDFDAREVKMDKLSKSVFLLYLKHPEGIRYKELCDYKSELEDIYLSVSGRIDLKAIRKSIDDLTDSTMSNSINEKVSKVKKAFRSVVDDRIAKYYYIDGKQGEIKTIALDRSLVLWE